MCYLCACSLLCGHLQCRNLVGSHLGTSTASLRDYRYIYGGLWGGFFEPRKLEIHELEGA